MDTLLILLALALLIVAAYRGGSVILFAPLAALLAVLLTSPRLVLPVYSNVFMERAVEFLRLYFPVFLLGAVFGKLMEISGFARAIIQTALRFIGPRHAIVAVVASCALLTYGGVSLFVVVFTIYPFAAELFRSVNVPKRLLPATIALGAFTFTMDALPGSPQIQNIIPTSFFKTTAWAAPTLGLIGAVFIAVLGIVYLEWRRRTAERAGEGYGSNHINEPAQSASPRQVGILLALLPLVVVAALNFKLSSVFPAYFGPRIDFAAAGMPGPAPIETGKLTAIWAVECALFAGIGMVLLSSWKSVRGTIGPALSVAVAGAMLAALNTASEYGFGAVISQLPGFRTVSHLLTTSITDPLLNLAVTTNILAGMTGSASGGMSIALAALGDTYIAQAAAAGIPSEVLHRVAAMASGGMDTLPHNGAVITLLTITGLRHVQSYMDIFVLTLIKTAAGTAIIGVYYLTHWV